MREVVPFKQEGQARGFCQRVDEAVSVVQSSLMPAAFAVNRKCVDGNLCVARCHTFHFDPGFLNKGMKLGGRFRSVPVHHYNSSLDQGRGRNERSIRVRKNFGILRGVRFGLQDREQRGRIDYDHLGRPFLS